MNISTEVSLRPYTAERCDEFWRSYISDPDMTYDKYVYDSEWVKKYYNIKVLAPDRVFFAICIGETTVGEIQLKRIDRERKCATMSIHLSRDEYKNRGVGTAAERMLIDYAFGTLGLDALYADCIHRNLRSAHVLKKVGFVYTHSDDALKYYKLTRDML